MKKNTLQKMILAAALLTLVSCTQDEPMEQTTALPDGVYPITFTAVQALPEETSDGVPQTRVSDKNDVSSWTTGDQIKVTVNDGVKTQETLCTMNANSTISTYNPQLYWQTTGEHTINAWYSNISGQSTETDKSKTVSLANQKLGLAYVLKAAPKTANYQTTAEQMELNFTHQLAKIRVELTGDKADDVTFVSIESYTSCTVNQGTVSGTTPGKIEMRKAADKTFEANVVPGQAITKFQINNDGKWIALKQSVTPVEGKWHKITIDVKSALINPDEAGTIFGDGEYLISGSGTKTLTISGGSPTVILQGVNINVTNGSSDEPAINITGGSPKIKVVGTNNTLSSVKGAGIAMSDNASLTIIGESQNSSSLTINAASNPGWDYASCVGIGAKTGTTCGDISISNITLDVTGGANGAAAIGTSGNGSSCGNITIRNSVIKATGGEGAAAIGLGYIPKGNGAPSTVKDISIASSKVTAIVTDDGWGAIGAGIGMCQLVIHTYTCGKIILDAKSVEDLTAFTTDWKVSGTATDKGYKIGKGYYSTAWGTPTVSFGGLYLNGQDKTQFNADGWGSW